MKKYIIFELMQKLKSDPALMKRAKGVAVAGLVGIALIGGLTIWAGLAGVKYLASTASQVADSAIMQDRLQTVKNELLRMKFQPLDCWGKAQSLAAIHPWIQTPVFENLRNLKMACLEPKPPICQGQSCEQIKQLLNTADGRTI